MISILAAELFDFSVDKFSNPLVIVGLVLLILSIFFVAGSSKLDEYIRRKMKEKKKSKAIENKVDNNSNQDNILSASQDVKTNQDAINSQDNAISLDNAVNAIQDEKSSQDNAMNQNDTLNDIQDNTISQDTEQDEELSAKSKGRLQDSEVDQNGEISMFRRKDGTLNYFYIFKLSGLVMVIVSAILVVVGLG